MMIADNMKIAVLDDYQHVAHEFADWSALPADARVDFHHDHLDEPAALVARLVEYDIICVMRERTPIDRTLLARLPKLKMIATTGMRNAAIDLVAAHDAGVTVCGTDSPSSGTPELIWLHILALARSFKAEQAGLRAGRWQSAVGRDLHGATLGVVGLGRIGQQVARVAQAFGMQVIAWSPNLTSERAAAAGVRHVSKTELFAAADFVVIALQLSEQTRGIIGPDEINAMARHAFLVNTSRAGLIDDAALLAALTEQRIAGAGIDVFAQEPLPADHPLRMLPNVVLTPHIGYVTQHTYAQFYGETLENILAWLQGKPIRVIN